MRNSSGNYLPLKLTAKLTESEAAGQLDVWLIDAATEKVSTISSDASSNWDGDTKDTLIKMLSDVSK